MLRLPGGPGEAKVLRRRRFLFLRVFPLVFAFTLSACATLGEHYAPVDEKLAAGDFSAACAELEEYSDLYGEKNILLYRLDAGMLAHYAGQYETSRRLLADAEKDIGRLSAVSLSLTAASYLANDTVTEYCGEDYEDIYLNVFNALNYYHLGSEEDAMVEIRRIDEKLRLLAARHGTEITAAQQALLERGTDVPYDSEAAAVHFSNSALARYLSMLFYRARGRLDEARIDRDQIRLAFANQPAVYGFPVPDSVDEELRVPAGKARLNIVGFTGRGPVKVAEDLRIPVGGGHWIRISLPVLQEQSGAVGSVRIVFDSGEQMRLEKIEDLSAVAAETFRQSAALTYLKAVLRATAKGSASMIFDQLAQTGESSLLFSVLSLGTQLYAEFSEQADLRLSHFLPAEAWVGGITLDPGVYSFTVIYESASGKRALWRDRFENVRVYADRLNLTETVCLR